MKECYLLQNLRGAASMPRETSGNRETNVFAIPVQISLNITPYYDKNFKNA
jgi:hypothetical protein